MPAETTGALIDLRRGASSPSRRALFRLLQPVLNRILGLAEVNRVYAQLRSTRGQDGFFPTVLRVMDIDYQISPGDRMKIPSRGPVIVVANHPFGAVDGLILGDILSSVRQDARILANELLMRIPEIRPWIIAVDAKADEGSSRANIGRMKAVVRWLRDGGLLGVFPSGTVSHLRIGGGVSDPAWHPNVATLVRITGATVVPMFFDGQNSVLFQLAGLLHPSLRTLLLGAEAMKRKHSTVRVRIGQPLAKDLSARYSTDETLIQCLRAETYTLRQS